MNICWYNRWTIITPSSLWSIIRIWCHCLWMYHIRGRLLLKLIRFPFLSFGWERIISSFPEMRSIVLIYWSLANELIFQSIYFCGFTIKLIINVINESLGSTISILSKTLYHYLYSLRRSSLSKNKKSILSYFYLNR